MQLSKEFLAKIQFYARNLHLQNDVSSYAMMKNQTKFMDGVFQLLTLLDFTQVDPHLKKLTQSQNNWTLTVLQM